MNGLIFLAVMAIIAWNLFHGMFSRSAGTKFTKSITWGVILVALLVLIAGEFFG